MTDMDATRQQNTENAIRGLLHATSGRDMTADILKPLGTIAVIRISEIVSAKYNEDPYPNDPDTKPWVDLIYRNGEREVIRAITHDEWIEFMDEARYEY